MSTPFLWRRCCGKPVRARHYAVYYPTCWSVAVGTDPYSHEQAGSSMAVGAYMGS